MPIVGIKDCGGGPPRSGIPVRVAPQNICDVNPYVCRMTPASINFEDEKPFVGRLSFEPHPRGCQCCAKAAALERESFQRSGSSGRQPPKTLGSNQGLLGFDGYDRSSPEPSPTQSTQQFRPSGDVRGEFRPSSDTYRGSRMSQPVDRRSPSGVIESPTVMADVPRKKMTKAEKKMAKEQKKREKRMAKQQKRLSSAGSKRKRKPKISNQERIRLLREEKRRDDFVTACCTGLLLTPCVSAGSCSEEADEREQANFYIQCKCCPGKEHGSVCQDKSRRRGKHADFPCQCRNCKYQEKGCTNRKKGCVEQTTGESPVCYCTDEEKKEDRPYRLCNDDTRQRGAAGKRGFFTTQGDGTVCDAMLPTKAGLLTCNKDDGDACSKMVMTAELMQEMLIKQAQQGIELANSLLTNKKFQLVDVNPENVGQINRNRSQPIQTSRTEQRSQFMQTSRSHQAVELNDSNLKCYLQDIDPSDIFGNVPDTGQVRLEESLPRPPLNPYQSEPYEPGQDDYYNASRNWNQPKGSSLRPTASYRQPNAPLPRPPPNRYPSQPYGPGQDNYFNTSLSQQKGSSSRLTTNYRQTNELTQPDYGYRGSEGVQITPNAPYNGSVGQQRQRPQNGITGHICIPRDALLQDPNSSKLCIPLSFDPSVQMESADCPFVGDHAQAEGVPEITTIGTHDSQRKLHRGGTKQGGSQQALHGDGSRRFEPGLSKQGSRQDTVTQPSSQKVSSRQGLAGVLPDIQAEGSRPRLQKEPSRAAVADQRQRPDRSLQEIRSLEQMEGRKTKKRESLERSRRKHSDQERRRRDSRRADRSERRRSDTSTERKRRRSDDPTRDRRRRKRSSSPCEDSDKRGDLTRKRRPSPSEMVKTLNGYETDLLQAMDNVKDKYLKKRGNETSSSKGSSFDSTPGLAEFNCLLKHITCLRKELKKYSRDDAD